MMAVKRKLEKSKNQAGKKILLVEDDPFLIDIYQKKLLESGFQLRVAKQGREALAMLKSEKPDLILLDIVLPGLGGWEVLSKIKKDPGLSDLKIIVLSNLGQREEVKKGLSLGAVKYMIKAQFTPAEVVGVVKKALG